MAKEVLEKIIKDATINKWAAQGINDFHKSLFPFIFLYPPFCFQFILTTKWVILEVKILMTKVCPMFINLKKTLSYDFFKQY